MKALFTFLVISLSASAFSSSTTLVQVLEHPEVKALENQLTNEKYSLSGAVDVYALTGRYPRCLCSKVELTFTSRFVGSNNVNETKKFVVNTTGHASNLQVNITEN